MAALAILVSIALSGQAMVATAAPAAEPLTAGPGWSAPTSVDPNGLDRVSSDTELLCGWRDPREMSHA